MKWYEYNMYSQTNATQNESNEMKIIISQSKVISFTNKKVNKDYKPVKKRCERILNFT